ncbi:MULTISPECIES: VOC family protein [Bacillaceae]|uniref:VOC family protein n=1 Tax=Metabacillus endolithicus TaxID=1535204 RepID=A0ABW5BWD5_9BACI|nr:MULTISPECIES: VOC family protein [Bacillaceae]PGT77839.1 glyoxalase [Bacillus sp. AFS040349]UGB29139.1 VOC family protein [Metabacillus sp. B2-18]UPG64209.1 VOC family protein [Metabacillus endolithicus]
MSVLGFEHVGIQVENIERSITFYKDVVGLDLLDQFLHTDGNMKLAFLGVGGNIIVELIEGYNPNLPDEGKVHHIAFQVDNIEKERDRLRAANVEWIFEEITELPNGAKYIFFRGPEKEWIEFFER